MIKIDNGDAIPLIREAPPFLNIRNYFNNTNFSAYSLLPAVNCAKYIPEDKFEPSKFTEYFPALGHPSSKSVIFLPKTSYGCVQI